MFQILCFHSICRRAWSRYKIQQGHCFITPPAHTSLFTLLTLHCSPSSHFMAPPAHTSFFPLLTLHCSPSSHFIVPLLTLHCSPSSHFIAPPAHTSLFPLLTLHCSPCSHFLLRQPQPEGLSHPCLMQPSDSLYVHKSCSLSPLAL